MAFSNKQGREYQSRRERGHRTTKFPKGYDRRSMPIICGLIDADGNECPNKTSSYGLCDEHKEEEIESSAGSDPPRRCDGTHSQPVPVLVHACPAHWSGQASDNSR